MALQTESFSSAPLSRTTKAQPTYKFPEGHPESFLDAVHHILENIIPQSVLAELESSHFQIEINSILHRFYRQLPIIHFPSLDLTAQTLPVTLLCPAEFTHGVGRYVKDTLSRWLIPGKQVAVVGEIGLNCYLPPAPSIKFFLNQQFIGVNNEEERNEIQKNLPSLVHEMKMNIMAVYQARYITSLRSYSRNHKTLLIEKNFNALFNRTDESLYDQVQALISKVSSEEKINEVKKNLNYLFQTRPKTFDRDIFYEMTQFTTLINDRFASVRESKNMSRLIAYHYIFKKVIEEKIKKFPQERYLSVKVGHSRLKESKTATSVLIVMNFLSESERFEQRHLMEAIKTCLPDAVMLKDSFLSDRRNGNTIFLYSEIIHADETNFNIEELKHLKARLPTEIIRQIETAVHPTFMPRNEEELLRNLILLCKEIKFVRDLPQEQAFTMKNRRKRILFLQFF